MTKTNNTFKKCLVVLLSFLMICSLPGEAYAQRSNRGGGASSKPSSRPASKPSSPSKTPSRSPTVSKPSAPKAKPAAIPSRSPSVSKPSNPSVSKPSAKAPDVKAAPPPSRNNATSSGRNSSLSKPTASSPKPISTALSGETRPRPPPSTNATSGGRNSTLSKPTASTPKLSAADKALYERAKQSGTVYTSREQAVDSFKAKYAKEFTTKFQEEPKVRPAYIPPTYTPSNNSPSHTIVYNQRYGGYGYWDGGAPNLGTFILYDALTDAAVTSNLMTQKGYYYGDPPTAGHFFSILGIIFGIAVVVIILVSFVTRK